MPHTPLTITWALSTMSGYGLYGLHVALQFLRRGGQQFIATHEPGPILLPTLTQLRLAPTLDLAKKLGSIMKNNPHEKLAFDHAVLYAVGNNCAGFAGQDRVHGKIKVGCAAIEHVRFTKEASDYARQYDMLIAISRWNDSFLKQIDAAPVHLCHQGIDTSLFMPGPSSGLWGDRFVIFSGGKFEFRKGQDIVVEAFKRFHKKHPDSLLVTCWQNLLPLDPVPFQMAGHCTSLPKLHETKGLQITNWLLEMGLPQGSFIDMPYTPNMLMPAVLRDCDAALFPNRCEGGTNLVAMEAMACGVPTVVANNTGQKDLVEDLGCLSLNDQKPVKVPDDHATTQDWGETDPDAVVEILERLYTQNKAVRAQALKVAEKVKAWDWAPQNEKLLALFC